MEYFEYRRVFCIFVLLHCTHAFFIQSFVPHLGSGSNPVVFCIMEHCRSQSEACVADSNCRDNMACMTKCGLTNNTCMYACMNTYEDAVFDAMMKCMVDDHHCLVLQPPDPDFRCKPPATVVKNFTLSQLEGVWYIVRGLNLEYDCFDCQISTYTPSKTSRNFTLEEKYDVVMLNGSVRHRLTMQQVAQRQPSIGGLLDYTNTMMGLTMYEKWQVLYYHDSGDYMIVYYCGHMSSNWWYEGGLVYSRAPVLDPLEIANIASVLKATTGHTMDEYCAPNTKDCQA